jgi:nucleotide-binding universal stress UspA family protein
MRAIEWAAKEAIGRNRRLVVLHAAVFRSAFTIDYPQIEGIERRILDDAVAKARTLIRGAPVEVEGVLAEPPPAEALIGASKNAELVVVGARGAGGWSHMTLGSVSQQVARLARCPVLVVRNTAS